MGVKGFTPRYGMAPVEFLASGGQQQQQQHVGADWGGWACMHPLLRAARQAMTPEEEARMKEQMEADAKRQKRLALNRKAAHESRKRKKVKFAALTK